MVTAASIIKLGTTTSVLFVAPQLDTPWARDYQTVNLLREDAEGRLDQLLGRWRDLLTRHHWPAPLVAGGEGLRMRPQLVSVVQRYFDDWWPLDGRLEGRLAWIGVKAQHPDLDVLLDIGGGSTECVTPRDSWSISAGALRPQVDWSWPPLSDHPPVVIGGTAGVLAQLWNRPVITREHIARVSERRHDLANWLTPERQALFQGGVIVLERFWDHYGWPFVRLSERGLLEGLWLTRSLGRKGPPES